MNKEVGFTRLSLRKIRRTIKRSPLQFLIMVIILVVASTLFSGLYASHVEFTTRVRELYSTTNMADVWTTAHYDNNDENPDSTWQGDYQAIKDIVGTNGAVEGQYREMACINGVNNYIGLYDEYPTINLPFFVHDKGSTNDNFFIFNSGSMSEGSAYGGISRWIDDDGNFLEATFEIDIGGLRKRLTDENLLNLLSDYKTTDKNIFEGTFLLLKGTPTGRSRNADSVLPNGTIPLTYLMSRKYLSNCLTKTINESFNKQQLQIDYENEPAGIRKNQLKECLDILSNPQEEIMQKYWHNNRFLTRLNNRQDAAFYREKISNFFKDKTEDNLILNTDLANTTLYKQIHSDEVQSLRFCYVFPPFFFLVSLLVVLTTLSQIIVKERGDIGTLKALGASNKSLYTYYLSLTGVLAFIGLIIGLIIGPLIIPPIMDFKFEQLYELPDPRYVFPVVMAIIMIVVVIALTLLVSYLVARKEIKASPATTMHPRATKIKNHLKLNNNESSTHRLCLRMAIRNIFSTSARSVMVIVGILGCVSLLTASFAIDDSKQISIAHDTRDYFNTDALIFLTGADQATLDRFTELKDEGTLTAVEPYAYLPTICNKTGDNTNNFETYIYSIDTFQEGTNKFFNLGYTVHNNNIAVSNKVAKKLNIKEGDSLNFTFLGKIYSGMVGKVVDNFYVHGIFIDGRFSKYPMVTQYPNCAYARFNKDYSEDAVMETIKAIPGVGNVYNKAKLTNTINLVSAVVGYITLILKVFAILLAIIVLYNLALLNFNDNIRNIATMKVLGFTRLEIAETLFFEIMILSSIGILIGLALGFPLAVVIFEINQVTMVEFFTHLSAGSIFLSLFITLGVSVLVNVYLAFVKNKKVKMVESLKSIE